MCVCTTIVVDKKLMEVQVLRLQAHPSNYLNDVVSHCLHLLKAPHTLP